MGRAEGRVQGKVALISGGARNIGGATARMLVAEGASVVIGDVLDEEGQALADELNATRAGAATYVHLDVTDDDQWRAAVAATTSTYGSLTVLFNNAGIFNGGQLQRYKRELWQQMLDVNLTGAFLGCRAAADAMIASGGGSIINTSSIEGLRGTPWAHGYVATKWAVRGLTKSVAQDFIRQGIRCNAICPGTIESPSWHGRVEELGKSVGGADKALAMFVERQPMGRVGRPEEVAALAVYLASDAAAFTTGTAIPIDGGWTL